MFEMFKIILLDALGIKAAPAGVGARGVMPAMDFGPDFGAATAPAMDRAGHVIGDRDYVGVIGDHD
jgi:hypothetical protein